MGAIPTSDMPGHKKLHGRVNNALDRCQESKSVDFKESATWDDLKWQLIRTIIAMGNLRDGGIIVIGASERGDTWELTGIEDTHLSTYDVDEIIDAVNKYASPPIKIEIVLVNYRNGKDFLAIQVHEFSDTPFVCKNNGPDSYKKLRMGEFYVRPAGKPRTTKVTSADDMHELLELAAEKRARRILEVAHRIGLKPSETDSQKFDDELGGIMNQKIELPVPVLNTPHWQVNFRPKSYNDELIQSLGKCFEIAEKTKLSLRGWDYPHLSKRDTERGQGANWVASWSDFMGHMEYWRFYQSGQFLHLFSVREAADPEWRKKIESEMRSHLSHMDVVEWDKVPGFLSIINFNYQITEIYEFAARLCEEQIYIGEVNIKIELKGIKGFVLAAPWKRAWHSYYAANEDVLLLSKDYESDVLIATSRDESLKAIVWFFERFGWLSPSSDVIRHDQENFLKGKF